MLEPLRRTSAPPQPRGREFRSMNPSGPQRLLPLRYCAVVRQGHERTDAQKPYSSRRGAVFGIPLPSWRKNIMRHGDCSDLIVEGIIQRRFRHLETPALAGALHPDQSPIEVNHYEPRHAFAVWARPGFGTHRYQTDSHTGLFAKSARKRHGRNCDRSQASAAASSASMKALGFTVTSTGKCGYPAAMEAQKRCIPS